MAGFSKPPWCLADVLEEVVGLIMRLNASYLHVLCNTNEDVDLLAKEGNRRSSLFVVSLTLLLV